MKTILTALAAVAAITAAVPAAAQAYGPQRDARYEQGRDEHSRSGHRWDNNGRYNINQRQERLDRSIDQGLRDRSLTRQEANHLREQFRTIAIVEARYRAGGLSGWERADLDRRFDILETRVQAQRNDREYGSGYGHRR